MARSLGNLTVRLTAETEDFRRGLSSSQKQLRNLKKDFQRFRKSTIGGALSLGMLTTGLGVLVNKTVEAADNIDKMSVRTGLARDTLQELEFASEQLGASMDGVEGVIESFTRRIPRIEEGTGRAAEIFDTLGESLHDSEGNMRSMSDLFPSLLRSLSEVENETERNAMATQLFGRRALQLVPLMEAGADGLDDLAQRARDMGIVMSDEEITGLVDFKDQWHAAKEEMAASGREIVVSLVPAMETLIPVLKTSISWVVKAVEGWQMMGAQLARVPPLMEAIERLRMGNISGAKSAFEEYKRMSEAAAEVTEEIRSGESSLSIDPPEITPASITPSTREAATETGQETARAIFDALESEWETLRHEVELRRLPISGEDRLDLELRHAHEMLNIEGERLVQERQAGELTRREFEDALATLNIRRDIAIARHEEMSTVQAQLDAQRALADRQSVLQDHRLETTRLMHEIALEGAETTAERLQLQLSHVEEMYRLRREALRADKSLSEQALENELLRLRLEEKRAKLRLKGLGEAQEEASKLNGLVGEAAGMVTPSGPGAGLGGSAAGALAEHFEIGEMMGGLVGSVIAPGIGSAIGSAIGGLFGDDEQQKQTQALRTIAENTGRNVTLLELEKRHRELERGAFNVPTGFVLPQHVPNAGGTTVHQSVQVSVSVENAGPDVVEALRAELGPMLAEELGRLGV